MCSRRLALSGGESGCLVWEVLLAASGWRPGCHSAPCSAQGTAARGMTWPQTSAVPRPRNSHLVRGWVQLFKSNCFPLIFFFNCRIVSTIRKLRLQKPQTIPGTVIP